MATAIQWRRGNTSQHANFTGLTGEITVDTDLNTLIVHDGSTQGGHRLAKYSEITALGEGDITNVIAGSGLTGGAESGNATLALDYENLTGNLIPSANNTYSLGSATSVWKDVFIGPGSLYVNGQKVLEDNSGTIQFSANVNQNISILTLGSGDLEFTAGGDIQLKSNVILSAGKTFTQTGGFTLASNINMNSNNINNVDDPVSAQDAATKNYVDTRTTSDFSEGTNLYYTVARANTAFDARFATSDTDDLAEGATNVYFTVARANSAFDARFATSDTDDLVEGSTNFYYTDSRTRNAISVSDAGGDGSISYNSATGEITYVGPSSAEVRAHFSGGDGISITSGEVAVDSSVVRTSGDQVINGTKTFGNDLIVSGNLTISGITTTINTETLLIEDNVIELNSGTTGAPVENAGITVNRGSSADVFLRWNEATDVWEYTRDGNNYTTIASDTDELSEGSTNLYYTDARAQGAISVVDNGGDGSLSYAAGVITYTGPSAAEVRAHFSEGTGVTITSGEVAIGQAVGTTSDVTFNSVTADVTGNLTGDVTGNVTGDVTGDVTGTVSSIANHDTSDLAEGTNLYYTVARANSAFDARLTTSDTDALSEGATNLYYTVARANSAFDARLTTSDTDNLSEGATNLYYTVARANSAFDARLTTSDTDALSEGSSNLYYTDARARGAISASGDLSYNSTTGVMSFTERTDAEVRGLVSGGTGIDYNSTTGVFSVDSTIATKTYADNAATTAVAAVIDSAPGTLDTLNELAAALGDDANFSTTITNSLATKYDATDFDDDWDARLTTKSTSDLSEGTNLYFTAARARGNISAGGDLSYNSSTGVISFTERTDAEVRGLVSATGDLSYNSTTGVFSFTERTDAEVRGLVSASGDLSYNSSTGVFSFSETYSTASELLTAIKTVDGAGSGLDADTIDGVQLSNIARTDVAETFTSDLTIAGNLTVSGTTTTVNTETVNIADNIVLLNSNATGSPTQNAGIEVERGDSTNVQLVWDEAADKWTVGSGTFVAGTFEGSLTGTVSSLSNHSTSDLSEGSNLYFTDARARGAISASGDLSYNSTTGVMSFTQRTDAEVRGLLSGGTGITYNSTTGVISLTDTGYVSGVTAGTGLTGGGTSGNVTLNVSGLTVAEFNGSAIQTSAEAFSDSDTVLMTAAAVEDKILSYGYTTTVGDITSVGAGNGLTGGGSSGAVTLNVVAGTGITVAADSVSVDMTAFDSDDLTEGTSNLYYTDARARNAISVAGDLSYNPATGVISFTNDAGDIESVTAGNGLTGGGASGAVTLNVGAGTGISVAADTVSLSHLGIQNLSDPNDDRIMFWDDSTGATGWLDAGTGISISGTTLSVNMGAFSTTNLSEGTNLYYTTARANSAIDSRVTTSFVNALNVNATTLDSLDSTAFLRSNANDSHSGDITPSTNNAVNLGSASLKYANVYATNFVGTATSAKYADLAEKYATDAEYSAGTVVVFGGDAEVTECSQEAHHAVAGVISTDPAYMMNSDAEGQYVALAGRVPVKVTGPVAKGDLMVTSSVPGHAKADNNAQAGRIIGKAIGSSEGGETVIEVLVNMM